VLGYRENKLHLQANCGDNNHQNSGMSSVEVLSPVPIVSVDNEDKTVEIVQLAAECTLGHHKRF
jgi:hypothetical protein